MPSDLRQLVIPVGDLALAEAFYGGVLGLDRLFAAPNVIAFALGPIRLLLTLRPGHRAEGAGVIPYLATSGIEGRHKALLAAGATDGGAPSRVAELGTVEIWIAFVHDPFGTEIGLIEERPIAAAVAP